MISSPDRVAGSLLGLALGDAIGFVVEAAPPEVAGDWARDWVRPGRLSERAHPGFEPGQYSDDTQLARELLASIADARGWDPSAFARRVAELFRSGRDVGAGPGTRSAALRIAAGAGWREAASPAPYAGNGTAMRVGPVGALLAGRTDLLRRVAAEQSRVTHADSRCTAGAVAIAGAAALATATGPIDPGRFLATLGSWVAGEDSGFAGALATLATWRHLPPDAAAGRLHALGLDPRFADRWRGISAFVVPTVLWSLYAFLRSPDDYLETVSTAVGVGGDTDTLAAMAGAIAGARLGPAELPPDPLAAIHDRGRWRAAELAALARKAAEVMT